MGGENTNKDSRKNGSLHPHLMVVGKRFVVLQYTRMKKNLLIDTKVILKLGFCVGGGGDVLG